jgi:magnesium-transporting ATPase (P-type)
VAIVLLSGLLSFLQEKRASDAVDKLLATIQIKAQVIRDRVSVEIPVEAVVPGDICIFNSGDVISFEATAHCVNFPKGGYPPPASIQKTGLRCNNR